MKRHCHPTIGERSEFHAGGLHLDAVERDLIVQALDNPAWNVSKAAHLLGISRDTLRYRMKKHSLAREMWFPSRPRRPGRQCEFFWASGWGVSPIARQIPRSSEPHRIIP